MDHMDHSMHQTMNHSGMDHSSMDHSTMDHGSMDHSMMNHSMHGGGGHQGHSHDTSHSMKVHCLNIFLRELKFVSIIRFSFARKNNLDAKHDIALEKLCVKSGHFLERERE